VRQLIREEIRAHNAGLPQTVRVRRFLLLERPLVPTGIEASLSRELRRHVTLASNAALVQSLFQSRSGDELVVVIEEVDEADPAVREPAHA
jgi:hypothetical protein